MTDVPMTRPEEALAIHDVPYGHSTTWVDLGGGRILLHALGNKFCTSDDGGITWSQPFAGKHEDGSELYASAACMIGLDGGAVGLTHSECNSDDLHNTDMLFKRSTDGGIAARTPSTVSRARKHGTTTQTTGRGGAERVA